MADEWYYMAGEQRCGPFDETAMQQLLQARVIQPDTNVAKAGTPGWIAARDSHNFRDPQAVANRSTSAPAIVKTLAWGIVPLAAFSLTGPLVWQMICESRYPGGALNVREFSGQVLHVTHSLTPHTLFDAAREWKLAGILLGAALLPGLVFSPLCRHLALLRAQQRPLPGWSIVARIVHWLVLISVCAAICFFSPTARAAALVSALKLQGVILAMPFIITAGVTIGIGVVAAYGINYCRVQKKNAQITEPAVLWAASITGGWAKTAISLALLSTVVPLLGWAQIRKKRNPDSLVAECLIAAIESHEKKTGEKFNGGGLIWNQNEANVGIIDGYGLRDIGLQEILARSTGDPGFEKAALENLHLLDTWNRYPFGAAWDGDGDGMLSMGDRKIPGRIAVWSVGWNGINEFGRGDDVIRVAR